MDFTFRTTPKIVFGAGCVRQIGGLIKSRGGSKCLLVTDAGILSAGLVERVTGPLELAGVGVDLFTEVQPEPEYAIAAQCASAARASGAEWIIGLGGGSSLDIAKVAAICSKDGAKSIPDLFGVDMVESPGLPTVMIPTTAGTGSEVTPIAILSDEAEQLKKGIVSDHLFPDLALLDPELTLGLPPAATAAPGMDALIHAVEAFTSINASPLSDLFATRAMGLIFGNLRKAYVDGANLEARSAMLEGSLLAGIAFANAGVTAVHAFAYPLGAQFHIPHGVANSVMLASVLRFNLSGAAERFARIAAVLGLSLTGGSPEELGRAAIDAIEQLSRDIHIPGGLRELHVPEDALPSMAAGAMKVTRLLDNNPRTVSLADALDIYRAAF